MGIRIRMRMGGGPGRATSQRPEGDIRGALVGAGPPDGHLCIPRVSMSGGQGAFRHPVIWGALFMLLGRSQRVTGLVGGRVLLAYPALLLQEKITNSQNAPTKNSCWGRIFRREGVTIEPSREYGRSPSAREGSTLSRVPRAHSVFRRQRRRDSSEAPC